MKLISTALLMLMIVVTIPAKAADIVEPVVAFILEEGVGDFAPSEAREVYVTDHDGHGFNLKYDQGALTVTVTIDECVHYNAPLTIFITDRDGDGHVDHYYYSLEEWQCGTAPPITSFPEEFAQNAFNFGIEAVESIIVARYP